MMNVEWNGKRSGPRRQAGENGISFNSASGHTPVAARSWLRAPPAYRHDRRASCPEQSRRGRETRQARSTSSGQASPPPWPETLANGAQAVRTALAARPKPAAVGELCKNAEAAGQEVAREELVGYSVLPSDILRGSGILPDPGRSEPSACRSCRTASQRTRGPTHRAVFLSVARDWPRPDPADTLPQTGRESQVERGGKYISVPRHRRRP